MLAKAILVHGEIGYKFFLLLPSEDRNQGHQLIDHQSTGHTPAGHEISHELRALDAINSLGLLMT